MADYTIDTFQDYLEGLCAAHTAVQHGVDGRRSFARFQSDEEVQQLTTNAGRNIVIVTRFYGRAIGAADDQGMRQGFSLHFASKALNYTTEAINEALSLSWSIMFDFVARWRKDVRDDSCHALQGIELQNLSWDELPNQPILESHYGWELTVPFTSIQPQYDAAKWSA